MVVVVRWAGGTVLMLVVAVFQIVLSRIARKLKGTRTALSLVFIGARLSGLQRRLSSTWYTEIVVYLVDIVDDGTWRLLICPVGARM